MDVGVRAVLAVRSDSGGGDTAAPELWLLLCHQQEGTGGASSSAWDAPAEPGWSRTQLPARCAGDSSLSADFHGSGAACLGVPGTCSRSVPVCAVPWSDSSCRGEPSPPHLPAPLPSAEPAFCSIHKIPTALIPFRHFAHLRAGLEEEN